MPEESAIQNSSKEVIQYLSKEIETTTNNMMAFRTKVSFTLLFGPFVILGVIASKGLVISLQMDWVAWIAVGGDAICFLALAFIYSIIEQHAWDKCNDWRLLIADLHKNPALALEPTKLELKYRARILYILIYSLLFLSFLAATIILVRIKVGP
jgi:hypothetical protein